MKKSILVSFAVSTALLFSSSAALAAGNSHPNQTAKATQVTLAAVLPSEVSGTVEKISGSEMTVKTKDEKSYIVPLGEFSKLDGFEALGLAAGTEVTLKCKPVPTFSVVPMSVYNPAPANAEIKNADGEKITLSLAAPGTGTVEHKESTLTPASLEITAKDSNTLTLVPANIDIKAIDVKAVDLKEMAPVLVTTGTPVDNPNGIVSITTSAGIKVVDGKALATEKGVPASLSVSSCGLIFPASEITANGKTVKLP